jgi:hypothetical protein
MNLQMDLLYNPLRTRPIQTGMEMTMERDPNRQFRFIDDPDHQSGSGSVPTGTPTRSDGPDPLQTVPGSACDMSGRADNNARSAGHMTGSACN